jgi:cell division protein ZapA
MERIWGMIMENKINVEIFGTKYPLKSDLDTAYMKKLSSIVDEHMRVIAKKNQYLPENRIGVLAALELADAYLKLKKDYDDLMDIFEDK